MSINLSLCLYALLCIIIFVLCCYYDNIFILPYICPLLMLPLQICTQEEEMR